MKIILLIANITLAQLGEKPWCSVLPNTPNDCHALDKSDCDGTPAVYCIYDTEDACKKGKLFSDERCSPNSHIAQDEASHGKGV